jgi:hypothetical protein
MSDKNYNYIWDKWLKAYSTGDFSEMGKETIDTLIKARGFLRPNSVHTDDWNAFNKYIDERRHDEKSTQIETGQSKKERKKRDLDEEIDRVRYEVLEILRKNKYTGIKRTSKAQIEHTIGTDSKILDPVLVRYEESHLIVGAYSNSGIKITMNGEKEFDRLKEIKKKFNRHEEPKFSMSSVEKEFDVFICHASEDKESFVRSLVEELITKGIAVWYDEFTLKLGDSLRKSIDKGLACSRYGIVVLSKKFFLKDWPEIELDGLAAREINGQKVILPIWHNITREEVLRYSPILADRLAISTSKGMNKIVEAIIDAIGLHATKTTPSRLVSNIQKRNNSDPWKKIRQLSLFMGIIAAIAVILTYFGLKPNNNIIPAIEKPAMEKIKLTERYAYEFDYYQGSSHESENNSRIIENNAILKQKYNAKKDIRITLGIANFNEGIPIREANLQVLFDKDVVIQDHFRWVEQEVNSRYSFRFGQNINNTPLNVDSIFVRFTRPGKHRIRVLIDGTYLSKKEVTYFLDLY